MATSKTYKQLRYLYIENKPMDYPPMNIGTQATFQTPRKTGWQLLPNQLLAHMLSPAQWWDVTRSFCAIRVDKVTGTVFNMIPLTETIAIQGNTTFTAFNNTLYALGYSDDRYETQIQDWSTMFDNFNIYQKEGLDIPSANNKARMNCPEYTHQIYGHPENVASWPASGLVDQTHAYPQAAGTLWDPFNVPDELMELRPGKNAIKYTWNRREDDTHEMYSLDTNVYLNQIRKQVAGLNQGEQTYRLAKAYFQTMNWGTYPLVDNWAFNDVIWKNLQKATYSPDAADFRKTANLFPPLGQFNAKFPIPNWFIKLIPLYDSNNALIQTSAQIGYLTEVTVTGIPRQHGAHFAPAIDNGCGGVILPTTSSADVMSANTSVYGTGLTAFYGIPNVIPHSASHAPRFGIDVKTNIFIANSDRQGPGNQ